MKEKFEEMHREGPKSWFDAGYEERLQILNIGWPWAGKRILEVGCGEGHLCAMIAASGAKEVFGMDTSETAIGRADRMYQHPNSIFHKINYRDDKSGDTYDVLVLQGLLEHLDHPWKEFQWMIDTFQPKEVVVSAPCFLNPRGYVWITLQTLFQAPMSLTDKHCLHPWEFDAFARKNEMKAIMQTCEFSWGNGPKMLEDYKQRLPKVFQDMGGMPEGGRLTDLFNFLEGHYKFLEQQQEEFLGAVAVYKLSRTVQNQP